MNTQEEDILIIKFLAGEASEDERIELDTWRNSDPLHEQNFLQSQALWKQSQQTEQHIDTDAAWLTVKRKLKTSRAEKTFSMYLKIAAAILLVCSAGWYAIAILYNPMIQVQTAMNEQKEVILPDGSVVSLNEGSTLRYPKKFNRDTRTVSLTGEAFFDITKNPKQPFVITSAQAITEVLGTSFNLNVPKGSHTAILNVITGRVRFAPINNTGGVIVTAGEKAEIDEAGNATKKGAVIENEFAWKSNKLVFTDDTLKEVFTILETYFNIKIVVENPTILNCHFTGTFIKPNREQVLDIISKSLQLNYTRKGKTVTITGKGCSS
jgi:transmembrane sensor